MPLPFIIGGIAAAAGLAGVGASVHGAVKMKDANDTMKLAQRIQKDAVELFETRNKETMQLMDAVGKKELKILESFARFSDVIGKIQGRPEFKAYSKDGVNLPEYEAEELQKISAGASVLLGGAGGAAAGTVGGFAAAGMTTSAVMAFGAASTGTAISSLSGVAATNATLAALGGGSLAAGGGGMALGSAVLGGATLGVGLLIGGIIFNATGSKLSDKADKAYYQAKRTEREVDRIVAYLGDLSAAAQKFKNVLDSVERQYWKRLNALEELVNVSHKTEWSDFTGREKDMTENAILLVGLLYKMCQVNLVIKSDQENGLNAVNNAEINQAIDNAQKILAEVAYAA